MTGVLALNGGGEFLPGDEPFLTAWLEAARARITEPSSGQRGSDRPLRVAIVPTAAARGRPDLVGAMATAAIERVASAMGRAVTVDIVPVLDAAAASDEALAGRLLAADAIHLPGGDPDLIPSILAGSRAWTAMRTAVAAGAAIAGASAGAMALAAWTWTPAGGLPGLSLIPDVPLAIIPHADADSWGRAVSRLRRGIPDGFGILGLAERTGILVPTGGGPWQVVGPGEVRWLPAGPGAGSPLSAADGPVAPDAPVSARILHDGDRVEAG